MESIERKLKKFMDSCDLNVFETINLAIQVASRLYPAELALRRDRIIERLYSAPNVRESSQGSTAAQGLPYHQRGSIDAKGKGKVQFSENAGTCLRNKNSKDKQLTIRPDPPRAVPSGTRQGQSSDAKGKGKEPCTDFAGFKNNQGQSSAVKGKGKELCTDFVGSKNNQGQSSAAKGKGKEPCTDFAGFNRSNNQVSYPVNAVPPREKVKKYGGSTSCKSLSISDGRIAKKLSSTNKGPGGSSLRANREKQGTAPAILDDGFVVSDDISDEEEVAEDPLDWWVDEEITRTDSSPGNGGVDMGMGGKNLKGSNGSNDA